MKKWGRVGSSNVTGDSSSLHLTLKIQKFAMNTEEMPQNIEPLFSRSLQLRQPV
jgi:hypothetical protein